jgi:uncharacterized protein YdgA (DUF945 family)
VDLNSPNEKPSNPNLFLTVKQHIVHGPLVQSDGQWVVAQALVQSQIHLVKVVESRLLGANTTNGILQINSLAGFDGRYQSHITVPQIALKDPDGSQLSWQGLSGNVDAEVSLADNRLQSIKSDILAGALAVQNPMGNLAIPSLKSLGERQCQQTNLCTGSSELSVPTIEGIYNNNSMKLVGTDLKTMYGLATNNAYSVNLVFALTQLTMPDYTVGPVNVKFGLNNLNADALAKMITISRAAANASEQDKDTQRLLLLAQYNSEAPHLITPTTTLTQDAAITTSYGNFTSTAKFYWPKDAALPVSLQDMTKMNFTVDLRAATKLVDTVVSALDTRFNPAAAAIATPAPAAVPVAAPAPVVPKIPPMDAFAKQLLQPYVTAHKMQPSVIVAVIDLQKQHLSQAIYGISIDKIIMIQALPVAEVKKLSQQLKDNYAQNYVETDTDATAVAASSAPAPAPAAVSPATVTLDSGSTSLKQELDAMLAKGIVVHDKDDYVVAIIYENGQMKINGNSITLPASSEASTQ